MALGRAVYSTEGRVKGNSDSNFTTLVLGESWNLPSKIGILVQTYAGGVKITKLVINFY